MYGIGGYVFLILLRITYNLNRGHIQLAGREAVMHDSNIIETNHRVLR